MFAIHAFGGSYFAQGPAGVVVLPVYEPHVIDSLAMYASSVDGFGIYRAAVDGFAMWDEIADSLATDAEE